MQKCVFVDSCTLGILANPNKTTETEACKAWALNLHRKDTLVRVPEIADYETRRSLIRIASAESLAELDRVIAVYTLVPICTDAMRRAAEMWANLRIQLGKGGTDDKRLDGDVIICAGRNLREGNGSRGYDCDR